MVLPPSQEGANSLTHAFSKSTGMTAKSPLLARMTVHFCCMQFWTVDSSLVNDDVVCRDRYGMTMMPVRLDGCSDAAKLRVAPESSLDSLWGCFVSLAVKREKRVLLKLRVSGAAAAAAGEAEVRESVAGDNDDDDDNAISCSEDFFCEARTAFVNGFDLAGMQVCACCEIDWFLSTDLSDDIALQCCSYPIDVECDWPAVPEKCTSVTQVCDEHPQEYCVASLASPLRSPTPIPAAPAEAAPAPAASSDDHVSCPDGYFAFGRSSLKDADNLDVQQVYGRSKAQCCLSSRLSGNNEFSWHSWAGKDLEVALYPQRRATATKLRSGRPRGYCPLKPARARLGRAAASKDGAKCPHGYSSAGTIGFVASDALNRNVVYACCEARDGLSNRLSTENALQCQYSGDHRLKYPAIMPNGCTGTAMPCDGHPKACCVAY